MAELNSIGLYGAINRNDIGAIQGHLTAKGSPDAKTNVGYTALGHAMGLNVLSEFQSAVSVPSQQK